MKIKFLTVLLLISLIFDTNKCFAFTNVGLGNMDQNFTTEISVVDESGKSIDTTFDIVPLMRGYADVPIGKDISVLQKPYCKLFSSANEYDEMKGCLTLNCGNSSDYLLKILHGDNELAVKAVDGFAAAAIPEGEFQASIENKGDIPLNCSTRLISFASDTVDPQDGFDIGFSCYEKEETEKNNNKLTIILASVIPSVTAVIASIATIFGVRHCYVKKLLCFNSSSSGPGHAKEMTQI